MLRSLSLSVKPEHVAELATDKTMDLAKVAMKGLRHDPRVASAALGVLGNLACSNMQFKKARSFFFCSCRGFKVQGFVKFHLVYLYFPWCGFLKQSYSHSLLKRTPSPDNQSIV